jgi:hypothetical protein
MSTPLPNLPKSPKDRLEIYRLFNGMSIEGKEGIDEGKARAPLVKTFLIEHVSDKHGGSPRPPAAIWSQLRAEPELIDDQFMSLQGEVKPTGANPYVTTVGYYRRVLIQQVHAHLLCHFHRIDPTTEHRLIPEDILMKTTDGVFQYVGAETRKSMRVLIRDNVFRRIAQFWQEKAPGIFHLKGFELTAHFQDDYKLSGLSAPCPSTRPCPSLRRLRPTHRNSSCRQPASPSLPPSERNGPRHQQGTRRLGISVHPVIRVK